MLGIGEAVAGYQMLKMAISGVKSALDTGKDASNIAQAIGSIFKAQDQINKEKNHNMTVKDQFGMDNIVSQEIDARLLEEQLQEIRTLCNLSLETMPSKNKKKKNLKLNFVKWKR